QSSDSPFSGGSRVQRSSASLVERARQVLDQRARRGFAGGEPIRNMKWVFRPPPPTTRLPGASNSRPPFHNDGWGSPPSHTAEPTRAPPAPSPPPPIPSPPPPAVTSTSRYRRARNADSAPRRARLYFRRKRSRVIAHCSAAQSIAASTLAPPSIASSI